MTRPSWVALHSMAYSFTELDKAAVHVISWIVFCDCGFHSVCPLTDKEKRLMEASWWERLTDEVRSEKQEGPALQRSGPECSPASTENSQCTDSEARTRSGKGVGSKASVARAERRGVSTWDWGQMLPAHEVWIKEPEFCSHCDRNQL